MRDLWGLARERQRGWRGQCCGRSSAWLWRTQPLGPCDLSRKLGVAAAPPLLEKEAHPLVLAGFGAPSAPRSVASLHFTHLCCGLCHSAVLDLHYQQQQNISGRGPGGKKEPREGFQELPEREPQKVAGGEPRVGHRQLRGLCSLSPPQPLDAATKNHNQSHQGPAGTTGAQPVFAQLWLSCSRAAVWVCRHLSGERTTPPGQPWRRWPGSPLPWVATL